MPAQAAAGEIVVTGASGFLGGRLVELLVAAGQPVTVVVRAASKLVHLESLIASGAVQVARCEPALELPGRATQSLRAAVRGARVVYHCAGCSTDWAAPSTYYQGNVTATEAMLAAASEAPWLERFVHVSTTDVYGYPRVPCDEEAPPVDAGLPYNRTKILGEQSVQRAMAAGLPATIVRPATIYGPRGTAFVTDIADLLRQRLMLLVDRGRAPGGFVYVDDVAEAMIAAAASPAALSAVFNLSSVEGESWAAYCAALARGLGLPRPWLSLPFSLAMSLAGVMEFPHQRLAIPGRPLLTRHAVHLLGRNQEFPIAKARAALGWRPRVSLAEGVERSVGWLRTLDRWRPNK